jgi:hypothetical protein
VWDLVQAVEWSVVVVDEQREGERVGWERMAGEA